MKTKACFKCKSVKPLTEFYKHPKMADGRLGKCKDCAKKDVAKRIEKKKLDPVWMANERARCRAKTNRARAAGTSAKTSSETKNGWRNRNPTKRRAHEAAKRAQKKGQLKKPDACERCQVLTKKLSKHHPNYSQARVVQWLCSKCHGFIHRKDYGALLR